MRTLRLKLKKRLLKYRLKIFEKRVMHGKVTSTHVEPLFQQLSTISNGFKKLKREFPFAGPDLSDDLDRIVNLYGHIITISQKHEVTIIKQRAQRIEEMIKEASRASLQSEINALKKHIYTFCKDNRPSKEGNEVLNYARKCARLAEAYLNGEVTFEHLECESTLETAEILFEAAYLYSTGNPKEGASLFNPLPSPIKEKCHTYLAELNFDPLYLPSYSLKWQQALLRTGMTLFHSEECQRFLTKKEIADFFKERNALSL